MNAAIELTVKDVNRALSSIGVQQKIEEIAERRAGEIELEAELSGEPVSVTVIESDDGVAILVMPDGQTSTFLSGQNGGETI